MRCEVTHGYIRYTKGFFDPYVPIYEKAAFERGVVQGRKKEAFKIINRMISMGLSDTEILEVMDITPEELKEIRNGNTW